MRILSLHPAATEIVFAIGAGGMLVGRSDSCDYPDAALRVPSVLDLTPEAAAVFEPDLILIGRGQEIEGLPSEKTMRFDPRTLEEVFLQILEIAQRAGKQVEAEVVVHDLMSVLERIKERAGKFKRTKVYFEVSHTPAKAASCYLRELIVIAGGEPIDDPTKDAPQVIISSVPGEGDAFDFELMAARPDWEHLNAIKHERCFAIDDALFYRPGPRLAQGARVLARILHGIEVNGV